MELQLKGSLQMRRWQLTGLLVSILTLLAFPGAASPQARSLATTGYEISEQETPRVETQLDSISQAVTQNSRQIERYERWWRRFLFYTVPLLGLLSWIGYKSVKSRVQSYVNRNLEDLIDSAVQDSLPEILEETQRRAEDHLLRMAKLLALRQYEAYDEALEEFGWDGRVASLRDESPTLRRAIIECLYSARRNRDERREAAWEAVNELVQDDDSIRTHRLYLRLSISLRKYEDGLAHYERHKEQIVEDREAALRTSTLLRKVGRIPDALELAKRYHDPDHLKSLVSIAVLERDLGNFDEAHDALLPAVTRLIDLPETDLPDGWHRVLNTFVANCIDRRRPEDAVDAAEFVLGSSPGPVEVFTAGRLIRHLPEERPERESLKNQFEAAIPDLMPGEATTRCKVLLHRMESEPDQAEEILRAAIEEGGTGQGESMKPDVYFQRCNLGDLLIAQGRFDDAIDELMPASGAGYNGEAEYRLAIAYASKGKGADAARWLREAIEELPKWAAKARDHDVLRSTKEVVEELGRGVPLGE